MEIQRSYCAYTSLLGSLLLQFSPQEQKGQLGAETCFHCLLQFHVQGHVVDLQFLSRMGLPHLPHKPIHLLILIAEISGQNQQFILNQQHAQSFLGTPNPRILGYFVGKLPLGHQILADIQPAHDFAVDVDLRIGGPAAVISEPVAHVLICQDIIVCEADLLRIEQVEEGLCEAALGGIGSALDEHHNLRFIEDTADLRVPQLLLLPKPCPKLPDLLPQGVKYHSNILGCQPANHFFIGLREQHHRALPHLVLFGRLRTRPRVDRKVFHILVIAEDGDGGLEALPELFGCGVEGGVEGEDEEGAEVVEESPGQDLVRLKLLQLSHDIIIET